LTFRTSSGNTFIVDDSNECILSVSTSKDISNPNGVFEITLSPRILTHLASYNLRTIGDIISPYDVVKIDFKVDDSGYHTEMIGLVARASVSLDVDANGAPKRVIRISGFDMGIVLKNFKIYFNPFISNADLTAFAGEIYFGRDGRFFVGNSPKDFVQNFVRLALDGTNSRSNKGKAMSLKGNGQVFYPLTLPGGRKISDYMDFDNGISTAFDKHTIIDPFFLCQIKENTEVSVYDIVKFYSDVPYHEVFMDLRRPENPNDPESVKAAEDTHSIDPPSLTTKTGAQPYVFNMRTVPFSRGNDKSRWGGLNFHQFYQTDVLHMDVAASEQNIYNYFDVVCERQSFALGDMQMAWVSDSSRTNKGDIRFPIQDQNSADRFGIKRFPYHTTKYVDFISHQNTVRRGGSKEKVVGKNKDDSFFQMTQIRSLCRQLFRWFSHGELFETGIMTVKGRVGVGPKGMTMGSKLVEMLPNGTPSGKEFYVESVMQDYALGQSLKTTMAVTRGHYPEDHYGYTDLLGSKPEQNASRKKIAGRFTLVREREKELHLDQANNSGFFNPIDPEDFPNGDLSYSQAIETGVV
jgi:hypothetical protein